MIVRIWRGPIPRAKLDEYAAYMAEMGLKEYVATPGNQGVFMLAQAQGEQNGSAQDGGEEIEVAMLTFWESWDAIRAFAGEPLDRAVYYPRDREFLTRFDEKVEHCEVLREVRPQV